MSDPLFDHDDDANTPLTAEEREALIPSYITLRHELNEAEQINVGQPIFTWGRVTLIDAGETRARYVEALQSADTHDIEPLLLFAQPVLRHVRHLHGS